MAKTKYEVSIYYEGTVTYTVFADNEADAERIAQDLFAREDNDVLMDNTDCCTESIEACKREVGREWHNDRVTIIYEDGTKKEVYMD